MRLFIYLLFELLPWIAALFTFTLYIKAVIVHKPIGSIYGSLILMAEATEVYLLLHSDTLEIEVTIRKGQQSSLLK